MPAEFLPLAWAATGTIITALATMIAILLKQKVPAWSDAFFQDKADEKRHRRQQEEADLAAQRAEEVAVFSQMTHLQMRMAVQHEKLLDALLGNISDEMASIRSQVEFACDELVALSGRVTGMKASQNGLIGEVKELKDKINDYSALQDRMMSLASYELRRAGINLEED